MFSFGGYELSKEKKKNIKLSKSKKKLNRLTYHSDCAKSVDILLKKTKKIKDLLT